MKNSLQLISANAILSFALLFSTQQLFGFRVDASSWRRLNNFRSLDTEIQVVKEGMQYASVSPKDVVINEIFADPVPKLGLPEFEYVELLNRSGKEMNLTGWQLSDQSSSMTLPDIVLPPGGYLILTATSSAFEGLGVVLGSEDFPSINNTDDTLILMDDLNKVIDSVHFDNTWYEYNDRDDGGYSLELIDPENLCSGKENWIASDDPAGGSPGRENSVLSNRPDVTGPRLLSAIPLDDNLIEIEFNEKLSYKVPNAENFIFEPPLNISSVTFADLALVQLHLRLSDVVREGQLYTVFVNGIADCAGNAIQSRSDSVVFGKPEPALMGDILINEILFNPLPGGSDFVELYNSSEKVINLFRCSIGNLIDSISGDIVPVVTKNFLLLPHEYLAITDNIDWLISMYPHTESGHVLSTEKLPPFNDDQGGVVIMTDGNLIIDQMHYSEDMHSVFVRDAEGVSLERISFFLSSADVQNWKSASRASGFATPGYVNSNEITLKPPEAAVVVQPKAFIPINGQPDFTEIIYSLDQPGHIANVRILDERGHLIKVIANNELLGTTGAFRWDGDSDDGYKARTGYYMVWFEVFDASGVVKTFKTSVAVGARF